MSGPASPPPAMSGVSAEGRSEELTRIGSSLSQLAEDLSVPRNIRRGAQTAREQLDKPRAALDVRIASAVNLLDDLANDPNLPMHGRTAIWSIMSRLESLK